MIKTALDLFSGIGGFTRAAEANGIEVLCHVEIDRDCQEYLRTEWPDVPVFADIKSFPAEQFSGTDLVMGGAPCQPVSCAGKRKGAEDDRWLWGEALKIVEGVRPRWCLFENPPGIRNMGLDGILSHLESIGYTTGTVDIPACAVNAPHIRQRYWIIGHLDNATSSRHVWQERYAEGEARNNPWMPVSGSRCQIDTDGHLADGERQGLEELAGQPGDAGQKRDAAQRGAVCDVGNAECTNGGWRREQSGCSSWSCSGDNRSMPWSHYHWTPCADGKVRRTPAVAELLADGVPVDVVDALAQEGWPKGSVLKALGNSIVWQIAAEVLSAIQIADGGGLI